MVSCGAGLLAWVSRRVICQELAAKLAKTAFSVSDWHTGSLRGCAPNGRRWLRWGPWTDCCQCLALCLPVARSSDVSRVVLFLKCLLESRWTGGLSWDGRLLLLSPVEELMLWQSDSLWQLFSRKKWKGTEEPWEAWAFGLSKFKQHVVSALVEITAEIWLPCWDAVRWLL